MKLFKCYDTYCIDSPEQVLFVWAKTEKKALRKCVDLHKRVYDCYDSPVKTVMNHWKVEECFVPAGSNVYCAYPEDITCASDVRLVSVNDEVANVEEYIMDQLAEMECQEEYFRDYVNDKAVNMGFAERFWYEDGEWAFTMMPPLRPTEKIKYMAAFDKITVDEYLNNLFVLNVNKFFDDDFHNREYINYMKSDDEADFDDGFYFYVCRKLIRENDWTRFDLIKEVDIVADEVSK
jgi:hypothetical protein